MKSVCLGLIAAMLLIAPPSRADRAGVESTMRFMERAVLAGDQPGYLKLVWAEDATLYREQTNWAKDLALHLPSEFSLAIQEPEPAASAEEGSARDQKESKNSKDQKQTPEPVFDDEAGIARFELVMKWTMPKLGREGADLTRTVSFPAVFRAKDGQWLYAGEDWVEIRSDGRGQPAADRADAAISSAPNLCRCFEGFEDVAHVVVDVLPEVRAHVDGGFENANPGTQEVKIYASMRHLQASIYLSYVDGLSGWNEPGEAIKLLASNKSSAEGLRTLLAHEYGHVATFLFGPKASDMPWWILEGVAELSAEKFAAERASGKGERVEPGQDAVLSVSRWAKRGRLAPWDKIADFRSTPREFSPHVYKQGQHMLGFISERFGRKGRNTWLRALAQGTVLDEATQSTLGLSFEELATQWRSSLPAEESEEEAPKAPEEAPAKAAP